MIPRLSETVVEKHFFERVDGKEKCEIAGAIRKLERHTGVEERIAREAKREA
jgi:hypothetical protein